MNQNIFLLVIDSFDTLWSVFSKKNPTKTETPKKPTSPPPKPLPNCVLNRLQKIIYETVKKLARKKQGKQGEITLKYTINNS